MYARIACMKTLLHPAQHCIQMQICRDSMQPQAVVTKPAPELSDKNWQHCQQGAGVKGGKVILNAAGAVIYRT